MAAPQPGDEIASPNAVEPTNDNSNKDKNDTNGNLGTADAEDVPHEHPYDNTGKHVWVWEPMPVSGVLTQDGIAQIAFHKYRAGTYTAVDNLLNPLWTYLTELLPLWLAPNLVTALGAVHCFVAYMVTWYLSPDFDTVVPYWVLLINAYCIAVYYTLDCMDGKQARRTSSSSPLGQLFDHGVDCLCLLGLLSTVHTWVFAGRTAWFFLIQGVLQFSFFVAQWEEYHTGTLPHATGQLGVTEVNYGLAVVNLINAFIDRKAIFTMPIVNLIPFAVDGLLATMELRHVMMILWPLLMASLISMSIGRVMKVTATKGRFSALSKLLSPLALSMAPLFLPSKVLYHETRYIHLAFGLALCLVSIKMIVYSMARQAYAAIQLDALPACLAVLWVRNDSRLLAPGIHLLWQALAIWYLYRILVWTVSAIRQILARLDIDLFTIPHPAKEKKNA